MILTRDKSDYIPTERLQLNNPPWGKNRAVEPPWAQKNVIMFSAHQNFMALSAPESPYIALFLLFIAVLRNSFYGKPLFGKIFNQIYPVFYFLWHFSATIFQKMAWIV